MLGEEPVLPYQRSGQQNLEYALWKFCGFLLLWTVATIATAYLVSKSQAAFSVAFFQQEAFISFCALSGAIASIICLVSAAEHVKWAYHQVSPK